MNTRDEVGDAGEQTQKSAKDNFKRFNYKVCGLKSASGMTISGITRHAVERVITRGLSLEELVDLVLHANIIYPDRNPGRVCQQKGDWKLVLDRSTRIIVTVIKLGNEE